ncbi:hypothetical protein GW17_00062219 [Ensete ventricosum]|nr:hypothetical protein GW17_00062219 [Ensete ventricosum]
MPLSPRQPDVEHHSGAPGATPDQLALDSKTPTPNLPKSDSLSFDSVKAQLYNGFYTCSSAPSLLQPLLLCSLCREYCSSSLSALQRGHSKFFLAVKRHQIYDRSASLAALRPSRSSISSVEVNHHQTSIAVDNIAVSLTSGQDLRPSQELDLAGA